MDVDDVSVRSSLGSGWTSPLGTAEMSILTHGFEVVDLLCSKKGEPEGREVVGRNEDKVCLQIQPPAPVTGNPQPIFQLWLV